MGWVGGLVWVGWVCGLGLGLGWVGLGWVEERRWLSEWLLVDFIRSMSSLFLVSNPPTHPPTHLPTYIGEWNKPQDVGKGWVEGEVDKEEEEAMVAAYKKGGKLFRGAFPFDRQTYPQQFSKKTKDGGGGGGGKGGERVVRKSGVREETPLWKNVDRNEEGGGGGGGGRAKKEAKAKPAPTQSPVDALARLQVMHPSTHPPTHPPTYPSIHSFIHPPTHPSTHPPTPDRKKKACCR